ncbi:MAG: bifunctional adenosylcobinamide kinase/adenosylcobinamide-phosphate guanylyltransferase [Actinomycetia bacterium]|nr:bifunctional adenosylcobinamide kinase/adenosylcobinamide-phosphate guanylyltransferase [Actinomycetes bacterium]
MILIVGAKAAGKLDYLTQSLGYAEEAIADAVLDDRPALVNLQEIVKVDPQHCLGLLPELLRKEVVACNEVGSGVIPISNADTEWREATGRLCNALACQADQVLRIVCGIPTVLK